MNKRIRSFLSIFRDQQAGNDSEDNSKFQIRVNFASFN